MTEKSILPYGLVISLLFVLACTLPEKGTKLSGPYLGLDPPGLVPEIFAPGIISYGFHELGLAISPDLNEMFYIMSNREFTHYVIVGLRQVNGDWLSPEVAPFTGSASNYALSFSRDGNRLFFSTKRPHPGSSEIRKDYDIWFIDREGDEWSSPQPLPGFTRDGLSEVNMSFTSSGRMYVKSSVPGEDGNLYYADFSEGQYLEPEKLDAPINTEYNESRPFIAPDESYLLFQSNRPGTLGSMDLYVSFRREDGSWGEPINFGAPVNTEWSEFGPYVSPDGKYLFFSSSRGFGPEEYRGKSYIELLDLYRSPQNGYATLYWMDAGIIEKLRQQSRH